MNIQKNKAFTLVELIVVITILAILGTIAFISLQGYSADARDSNRITILKELETGLELYSLHSNSSKYPSPDNISGTGEVNGDILANVGTVGENITRITNISKIPLDPLSENKYVYGTDIDRKYYQIAITMENLQTYNSVLPITYASNGYFAKVVGNYKGLLVKGEKIYNLPSVIFSGSGNLLSTGSYFIVDKQPNLPYGFKGNIELNNKSTSELISELTNNLSNTLTGVTKPNTMDDFTNLAQAMANMGYNLNLVGKSVLGKSYEPVIILPNCFLGDGVSTGGIVGNCSL